MSILRGPGTDPAGSRDFPFPVNLICVNADGLPEFVSELGTEFAEGRYSIGLWFWEVSLFPERWKSSFEDLDEVWAATDHVAGALEAVSPIPVTKVTVPIVAPPGPLLSRGRLGLPAGFCYLFAFDYNSVFERKNPLAVVEAFTRAFPRVGQASLVLKSINHEHARSEHDRLLAAVAHRPDIHVIDRYVTAQEKNSIIAACDCYVSLHRSEGLGITMGEAMAYGRPVIATGYSGNLDFMTEENSWLVRHTLVPIGPGADPYPPEGEWAEPDLEHAAHLMREVELAESPDHRLAGGGDARARRHPAPGRFTDWELVTSARRSAAVPRARERLEDEPVRASATPFSASCGPTRPSNWRWTSSCSQSSTTSSERPGEASSSRDGRSRCASRRSWPGSADSRRRSITRSRSLTKMSPSGSTARSSNWLPTTSASSDSSGSAPASIGGPSRSRGRTSTSRPIGRSWPTRSTTPS